MKTLAASLSILTREGVMLYLLRGVAFTCIISVLGVIMGLIVGSLLALARTYCKRVRPASSAGSLPPTSSCSATRPTCSGSSSVWCSVPARAFSPARCSA